VTLWAASGDAPRQLAQTRTDDAGGFVLTAEGAGADLYLVAKGGHTASDKANEDNFALVLMTVGGFVGGGVQMHVDIAVDPAGDVWVGNNWQMYQAALEHVDEAQTTLGARQGLVVFYGMAKPVRTPLIGPARPAE